MITELNYTKCLCCARGCIRIALKILDRRSPKQGLIREKISHKQNNRLRYHPPFRTVLARIRAAIAVVQ